MRRGKEWETVVSLSGVGCTTASGKRILDGIDLDVRRGECVLIIGRSGSGKTTVTKCINGLIPSFESGIELEGQVRVCGLDPSACEMYELAEHVGSVFQNPKSQFFCLTSNDELAFGLETRGVPVDEIERRIEETVEALGAQRLVGRDVSTMSGGEKQSLVFASVDVAQPDVLVLDEPTANLDASSVRALHDEIAAVLAAGKSVVIAEHRLYFAADLADRAVLIEGGRIVREFSPEELFALSDKEREILGLRAVDPAEALKVEVGAAAGRAAGRSGHAAGDRAKAGSGLVLSSFTVARKGMPVFAPVDAAVPRRRVLGVLGENGAGKSTFLRGIAGLERGSLGEVSFDGTPLARKQCRRTAALVMQDVNHQLFSDSVWNECALAIGGRDDGEAASRVRELLGTLDLSGLEDVHPMALSGGQKQRLSIACALLSDRRLLLLDEPTSGLDFDRMVEVARLVRRLADDGACIVLVTHDLEFLNRCCDDVLELACAQGGNGGAHG